jgi:hypothetical protein
MTNQGGGEAELRRRRSPAARAVQWEPLTRISHKNSGANIVAHAPSKIILGWDRKLLI